MRDHEVQIHTRGERRLFGHALLSLTAALSLSSAAAAAPAPPPLLTADQRQVDQLAVTLVNDPGVKAARAAGRKLWSSLPAAQQPGSGDKLDGAVDEAVYLAVRAVAANEAGAPKVVWTAAPPYAFGVLKAPGSRYAGDNPDRIYRTIAVDPTHRYVIRGRRSAEPSNEFFSFEAIPTIGAQGAPKAVLSSKDIDVGPDGSFTVTADSDAAPGQRNHLTLPPGTSTILTRDTLADWSKQSPNQLTVERVDAAPAPARSPAIVRQQAADEVVQVIQANVKFLGGAAAAPVNELKPHLRRPEDGVPGAVTALSRFTLKPDEALVLTIQPQSARYVGLQLTDAWFRSIDYWDRTSSLSNRQARPNADGSITYVVAARDPGYRNWLDTGGLSDGLLLARVEEFDPTLDLGVLFGAAKVVPISQLAAALPADAQRISPAERAQQLAERKAGYVRRVVQ